MARTFDLSQGCPWKEGGIIVNNSNHWLIINWNNNKNLIYKLILVGGASVCIIFRSKRPAISQRLFLQKTFLGAFPSGSFSSSDLFLQIRSSVPSFNRPNQPNWSNCWSSCLRTLILDNPLATEWQPMIAMLSRRTFSRPRLQTGKSHWRSWKS